VTPLHARGVALVVGTLFLFGGPLDRQVLGNDHPVLKDWRPYGGAWLDVCVAEYSLVRIDGVLEPVDHIAALHDGASWWQVPLRDRRLKNKGHVRFVGRRLCETLNASDIRVRAKCAINEGYSYFELEEENLCR